MTSGKGSGVTSQRVKELVSAAVKKESQYAVAKQTGLALSVIQGLLRGDREPTTGTLQKLSAYFDVSVPELRGESSMYWENLIKNLPEDNKELLVKIVGALSDRDSGHYYDCFQAIINLPNPACLEQCRDVLHKLICDRNDAKSTLSTVT